MASPSTTATALPKRAILFAMEFADPIFSGNGTYARTIVQGLCQNHTFEEISVITAVPCDDEAATTPSLEEEEGIALTCSTGALSLSAKHSVAWSLDSRVTLHLVPVDAKKWFRVDRDADWLGYAEGARRLHRDAVLQREGPAIVFAVDWHGMQAYRRWSVPQDDEMVRGVIYLNFRVFANPAVLQPSDELYQWYCREETEAVREATHTIALSEVDKTLLLAHAQSASETAAGVSRVAVSVVLPPVRDEVLLAAAAADDDNESHSSPHSLALPKDLQHAESASSCSPPRYVVCCVRVSPEKNPQLFVEVMGELFRQYPQFVRQHRIVPLMFGATPDVAMAERLHAQLAAECPTSRVLRSFVSPSEMVAIFRNSVLNFHPCLYDAYGLTIVEAAVSGCLSLVHCPTMPPAAAEHDATTADCAPPLWSLCQVGASALMKDTLCYADYNRLGPKGLAQVVYQLLQQRLEEETGLVQRGGDDEGRPNNDKNEGKRADLSMSMLMREKRDAAKRLGTSYGAAACSAAIVRHAMERGL